MVLNFIIITIMEVIKVILEDSQITSKVKLWLVVVVAKLKLILN
jgi:hypothetical protein